MMINADAKNARVHFRHEFGVLGLFFVRDETRAKEEKDMCGRYLSRGIYCSALIDSWAVSAASASSAFERLSLQIAVAAVPKRTAICIRGPV